jgi:hypothetical protein
MNSLSFVSNKYVAQVLDYVSKLEPRRDYDKQTYAKIKQVFDGIKSNGWVYFYFANNEWHFAFAESEAQFLKVHVPYLNASVKASLLSGPAPITIVPANGKQRIDYVLQDGRAKRIREASIDDLVSGFSS